MQITVNGTHIEYPDNMTVNVQAGGYGCTVTLTRVELVGYPSTAMQQMATGLNTDKSEWAAQALGNLCSKAIARETPMDRFE